ncbi:MAG: hypothetical protein MR009_10640 [Sutterellaceae bacterium]|nr:hypothetical protein [Sutterellaceae bacterium]MDD7442975.1 hypothetical protein [Sutterellaceae bacterium]MDY2868636.1 hypothetical protein [Mesosutterella sp.]
MAKVSFSGGRRGAFGIVGHVGVAHVHSHSGFVQDDSAGFAAAGLLLRDATNASTRIALVQANRHTGLFTVFTEGGGRGTVHARRGITPAELRLAEAAVGRDALFSQVAATETFGRIAGQGSMEAPAAFQGACALAALDTFVKASGGRLRTAEGEIPGNYDRYAGTVLDIDGIPCSVLLVVNGTDGGLGPDEDCEGNTNPGAKGRLMADLGLNKIPTAVLESKAYIPSKAEGLRENTFLVRAQAGVDCTALGAALKTSADRLGLPSEFSDSMMPLAPGSMERATREAAARIMKLASEFASASKCEDKVQLAAELNRFCSEDLGGVTFMGNEVNDRMRGAGTLPGITAVLSMMVTREYRDRMVIPEFTPEDARHYHEILAGAFRRMAGGTRS